MDDLQRALFYMGLNKRERLIVDAIMMLEQNAAIKKVTMPILKYLTRLDRNVIQGTLDQLVEYNILKEMVK